MARPQKNNADYFPHDNSMWSDRKIVALRNRFGLTGYAVWNLLLETLCESENFEIDFDDTETELLANFWGLDTEKLKEILTFMERLKLINIDNAKLWSNRLKERLKPVLDERERKRKWARKRWEKDGTSEELDGDNEVLDGSNPSTSEKSTATRTQKESKGNKRKEKKSKPKKRKVKTTNEQNSFAREGKEKMTQEDFDDFWKIFPKKRSKQKAQEKFLKLPRAFLPKILRAVREQTESNEWQKEGGQFIPHPTTWLNGKRWEDDIDSYNFNNTNHGKNQRSGLSGYVSKEGYADLVVGDEDE